MTDERIPLLEQAFAKAEQKLDDHPFVAEVMTRIPTRKPYFSSHPLLMAVFLAPGLWFAAQAFGDAPRQVLAVLSQPLVGALARDSLAGGILAPINSLVGMLGLGMALFYVGYRRLVG